MSGTADGRGQLLISRYQIHQTVLHPDAEGADWQLALMRHPWEWLAEFDQRESQEAVHRRCDLLLHSHFHEARLTRVLTPGPKDACIELAAGGLNSGGSEIPAFQWIELQAQPRAVRVRFRLWHRGQWQPDRNQPGAEADGMDTLYIE